MQVGAGGQLTFSVLSSGDIQISFVENDAATSETIQVAVHPAVVQAALIKLLGSGAVATELVQLAFMAIPAAVAALPK